MASYDGSLKFDTKVDSGGFESGVAKLKSAGTVAVKAIGAGLAAAGAAVAALVGSAVKAYADYEQLVGGVDTLFADSSQRVQEYANQAYHTAGLSANQYMEQVTSFSASLLQSLNGNTQAAADKANQAIIDMSDNANKMGTSIDRIQDAYQGFAKQNFTMLDNLKLGYGGTKTEMERLLADAEAISGIKYDVSSYADIVDAIHVVQTELGIAGTTALEANTTIQGSLMSVKAAWTNLTVGFADDTQNLDGLISKFSDSVGIAFKNIVPRITQALTGISRTVPQLASIITKELPVVIKSTLPAFLDAATDLVVRIAEALPGIISAITDALPTLIGTIVNALPALLPALISGAVALIVGVAGALPDIISAIIEALPAIIESICTALIENIPILIQGAMQLVIGLVQALPEIITALIDALPSIITMVVDVIINNIPLFIEATVTIVFAIVAALPEIFFSLIKAVVELVMSLVTTIKEKWPEFKAAAEEWFRQMLEGMKAKWEDVKAWSGRAWDDFVQWCVDVGPELKAAGAQVLDALWSGLKEAWAAIKAWFTDEWDSLFATSTSASGKKIIHVNQPAQGSHAAGLDYVPFDGYTAELHRGEMVVPAASAAQLRAIKGSATYFPRDWAGRIEGGSRAGSSVNVTQNIYGMERSPATILREAIYLQERAVLTGV